MVNAIKLAIEENGGKAGALTITYVALDSSTREAAAWTDDRVLDNARQAVRDINAIAYIGDRDSAATALSLPLTNEGGILQVSPTSSYDGLTRSGGVRTGEPERFYPAGTRTFGRMVPPDHVQASALVGYMKSEGVRRSRCSATASSKAAGSPTRSPRRPPRRASRSSTRAASTPRRASSRATPPTSPRPAPTRSCSPATASTGAPRIVQAVGVAAPGMLLFGPAAVAQPSFIDALTPAVRRRMRITTPTLPPRLLPPAARAFRAKFRSTFGRAPAPEALLSYEATQAVLASIRAAGSEGQRPQRRDRRRSTRSATAAPCSARTRSTASATRACAGSRATRVRGSRLVLDKVLEVRP